MKYQNLFGIAIALMTLVLLVISAMLGGIVKTPDAENFVGSNLEPVDEAPTVQHSPTRTALATQIADYNLTTLIDVDFWLEGNETVGGTIKIDLANITTPGFTVTNVTVDWGDDTLTRFNYTTALDSENATGNGIHYIRNHTTEDTGWFTATVYIFCQTDGNGDGDALDAADSWAYAVGTDEYGVWNHRIDGYLMADVDSDGDLDRMRTHDYSHLAGYVVLVNATSSTEAYTQITHMATAIENLDSSGYWGFETFVNDGSFWIHTFGVHETAGTRAYTDDEDIGDVWRGESVYCTINSSYATNLTADATDDGVLDAQISALTQQNEAWGVISFPTANFRVMQADLEICYRLAPEYWRNYMDAVMDHFYPTYFTYGDHKITAAEAGYINAYGDACLSLDDGFTQNYIAVLEAFIAVDGYNFDVTSGSEEFTCGDGCVGFYNQTGPANMTITYDLTDNHVDTAATSHVVSVISTTEDSVTWDYYYKIMEPTGYDVTSVAPMIFGNVTTDTANGSVYEKILQVSDTSAYATESFAVTLGTSSTSSSSSSSSTSTTTNTTTPSTSDDDDEDLDWWDLENFASWDNFVDWLTSDGWLVPIWAYVSIVVILLIVVFAFAAKKYNWF